MLNKFKMLFPQNNGKDGKKKIENLVVFIIILIVTVLLIKMFCSDDIDTKTDTITKVAESKTEVASTNENDFEARLENILSKIEGAGQVKVLITYSQTNEIVPIYNEDSKEVLTEEKDDTGGTRTINETENKKEVIYEESNGNKNVISKSIISPKIEGAIIISEGAENVTIKSNIIQAVEAVTGIATHKIQVFKLAV